MAETSPTIRGNAASVDQDEKRKLIAQENSIINAIVHSEGTMKDKILELAQIIERRIELLDCDFALPEISTYITRQLRQFQCPIADVVRRYLPEKYKNPDFAKWGKLASLSQNLVEGGLDVRQRIEDCSTGELESILEYKQKAKHELDSAITILNNDVDAIRREAVNRGLTELAGEKIRDQISARDYRWEIPDDAELEELYEETRRQCRRVIDEYIEFIDVTYPEYRTPLKEKERQYGNSFRVYANMMHIVNELKWSGDIAFWLDRNYWKKVQSSHDAGNSTKFPTTLCARCSADIADDPKDYHISKYDKTSPTGYRCDNCGSTEILVRENSREQVGDKSPEVDRMAIDIVNHIEHYVDIFQDIRQTVIDPAIYARKKAISNEFRIASMGKEKIVVPRKKQ
jgi:DNA-directed RNA polymerase subunit RPC12/RpoP